MTTTEEIKQPQTAEKKTLYTLIAELGEYFTWVFVRIAKFLGLCFMYLIATIYEPLTHIKEPVGKFFSNIGKTLASPFKRRRKAARLGRAEINSARRKKGTWGAIRARFRVMRRTVFGKRGLLATVVNWALPVLSCMFLFNIIAYANTQNYALKLIVNDDFIGYISSDSVFTEAEKMVQNRINYTGSNTEIITFEPVYEVENVGSSPLLNQYQVADKMLTFLGKEVNEGYGLYLGSTYFGTLTSHEKLDRAMANLLAKYSTGEAKETVAFDKDISYISGTYLADSFVDEDAIIKQFTGNVKPARYYTVKEDDDLDSILEYAGITEDEFMALNPDFDEDELEEDARVVIEAAVPFRTVVVSREEHYTEEFAFDTEYVNDSMVYAGNKAVKTAGHNGEYAIVANVSYVNGIEVGRRVLSRTVTKEPITEVIAVGTKPRRNDTAPGQTIEEGLFLWPTEESGLIAEPVWWMGGYAGHRGVDILTEYGAPIYAAHNGVVKASVYAWNGDSRGNYVIIQGDDGLTTYYYHNSELVAYPGQRVTAGDLIAYAGMTGRAYGIHLHLGVSVGDLFLDPMDYLPYKSHRMNALVASIYGY